MLECFTGNLWKVWNTTGSHQDVIGRILFTCNLNAAVLRKMSVSIYYSNLTLQNKSIVNQLNNFISLHTNNQNANQQFINTAKIIVGKRRRLARTVLLLRLDNAK